MIAMATKSEKTPPCRLYGRLQHVGEPFAPPAKLRACAAVSPPGMLQRFHWPNGDDAIVAGNRCRALRCDGIVHGYHAHAEAALSFADRRIT